MNSSHKLLIVAGALMALSTAHGAPEGESEASPQLQASALSAASAAAAEARTAAAATQGMAPARPRLDALRTRLDLPTVLPLGETGTPLSLADAVQLGLANSPDVQAAQFREQSFAQTRNAARGALLPHMELRAATGRGRLESSDPEVLLPRKEATAVLSQALFDEPARQEWTRQQWLTASAQAQRIGAESQALLDTGNAWLMVLQQRVALELGNEYEKLLAELLRYVSERAAAGGTSPAERERVNARVANLRSSLSDTRAALQAAQRNFQRLAATAPAALSLDDAPELGVPDNAEAALALAKTNNAELQSAHLDQEAADAERRGRFLPRLSLELTHTRSRNASGTESYTRDSKAMAVLTVPLVNGGSDWAQMRAAEARFNELNARAEGVSRRIVQDIETAYANLRASSERYTSVREELDGNRKVVEAFRAQLVGGNRQLLDVLDAYQRAHQSRLDLVQVLVSTAQNEWRVAHLTGNLRGLVPAAR